MPLFRWIGGVECGDATETVAFRLTFPLGELVDVTDANAVAKLRDNRFFEEVTDGDGSAVGSEGVAQSRPIARRRGRPPKQRLDGDGGGDREPSAADFGGKPDC